MCANRVILSVDVFFRFSPVAAFFSFLQAGNEHKFLFAFTVLVSVGVVIALLVLIAIADRESHKHDHDS